MKTNHIYIVFVLLLFSSIEAAVACPMIGGHVDYNCDGKHRMAFAGDSITRGVGDSDRTDDTGGFVLDLQEANPESAMLNLGDPGATSSELYRKLKRNILAQTSKVVKRMRNLDAFMILIGTNDYWKRSSPMEIVRNIKRLLKFLNHWYEEDQGTVAPVYVIATLPPTQRSFQNPFIEQVNRGLLAAKSKNFPVQIRFDRLKPSIISGDHLHPNSAGYYKMSRKVQHWLDRKAVKRSLVHRHDADGDSLYDELEPVYFGTDPLVADTDGEGLLDGAEVLVHQTNPLEADTDGDGTDDATEITNGTDPNDPAQS